MNDRAHPRGDLRRPHVCMIVHSHYPVGEPRVEREARAAVEAHYVVDVLCLRSPEEEAAEEIIDGVRVLRLPIEHVRGAGLIRFFGEYLRFAGRATAAVLRLHRRQRIDVVYVHAPPDFLILSALIPKLLGSKVVLDVHDLSPHMFAARFEGRRASRLSQRTLRLVERAACALADRVVTVHEPYRRELAANGVSAGKITVVMNAPFTDQIERARVKRTKALDGAFLVAYHGTITHWYGVDLLVEAISLLSSRVPQLRTLILGEGDALASTEALARRRGIDGRIDFSRRYLPHGEALRLVAAANCGVIPNRSTTLNRFALSSKLFEYVALDIPVVVARLETLAAHFADDEVTFFEPDDPESLAQAIAWVAEHQNEAQEKAKRALERSESYSWDISRARFLETLAGDSRGGAPALPE